MKNQIQVNTNLDDGIKEIKTSIESGKMAIFCGSGISYNSGIPLVDTIIPSLLEWLACAEEDRETFWSKATTRPPFEFIIHQLKENMRLVNSKEKFIQHFADKFKAQENLNHQVLAYLLQNQKIAFIGTTNFDTCIEQAMGWELDQKSPNILIGYQKSSAELKQMDLRGKLIKLHGCRTDADTLGTSVDILKDPEKYAKTQNLVRQIFFGDSIDTILFLGYSCSDVYDIVDMFNTEKKNKRQNSTFKRNYFRDIFC